MGKMLQKMYMYWDKNNFCTGKIFLFWDKYFCNGKIFLFSDKYFCFRINSLVLR